MSRSQCRSRGHPGKKSVVVGGEQSWFLKSGCASLSPAPFLLSIFLPSAPGMFLVVWSLLCHCRLPCSPSAFLPLSHQSSPLLPHPIPRISQHPLELLPRVCLSARQKALSEKMCTKWVPEAQHALQGIQQEGSVLGDTSHTQSYLPPGRNFGSS